MNNKEKNLFFVSDKSANNDNFRASNNKEKKKTIVDHFSNDVIVVRLVFFVGVLAVVFGIWKMAMQIKSPFIQSGIVLEDKEPVIQYLNRLKDSDGDGVSDYEEQYVYGTSPYLSDTDSDGISDYDEIQNLASSGADCTGDSCKVSSTVDIAKLINSSSTSTTQTFTTEDIKKALVESGYSQSMVDQLSESDLQKIQQEIIKASNDPNYKFEDSGLTSDASSTVEIPSVSQDDVKDLESLSADEIRKMMIANGADESKLSQISDEDLKQIYIDAVKEAQAKK